MTADWREQAYEDQYWAEWTARDTAIAANVERWRPEDIALFVEALEQTEATRAEEREEVRDDLTPVGYDGTGSPLYSWQVDA